MRLTLLAALILGTLLGFVVACTAVRASEAEEVTAAQMSTNLVFECLPDRTIRVHFSWLSTNQGSQWLDLSLFDNGFASGTFLGVGPLASGQSGFTWDGLVANTQHYVRVNTLTRDGWVPSQTMAFSTPNDCPFALLAPTPNAGAVSCTNLTVIEVSGCVWTGKQNYGAYGIGEIVNYCYFVSQPTQLKIIAFKPDGSSLVIVDGFVDLPGACIGPYQANVPLGLRTVQMYGGPDFRLLDETHFYVQ